MDCQMTKWKQGLSLVDVVGRDTSFVDRDIFLRGSSRASNSIDVRVVPHTPTPLHRDSPTW